MFQTLSCLPYVFSSVLACAKSAHVFQKLSYSLCGLGLSFLTDNSSLDSKAFPSLIVFSDSPTPCFPLLRCEGMAAVTNWPLHMHYGTTLWAYISQMHRLIPLHCMHYGITLWAYLSEPLVKDSHKHLSSTEKPQCCVLHVKYTSP